MNQTEAVLAHLQKHKSITSWEAIQEYGATRLLDIIYRLRDRGYEIQNIWEETTNRFGTPTRYVRYVLIKKEQKDLLPKNAESRCIAISIKLIKKHYPNIKWIISFADGCQCGDGTIYRASGFKLTGIKKNTTLMINKDGDIKSDLSFNLNPALKDKKKEYKPLEGYQLRYIYFIDKSKEKDLTVPVMSFTMIDEMNARMYKGVKGANASIGQEKNGIVPDADGGVIPTCSHQDSQV